VGRLGLNCGADARRLRRVPWADSGGGWKHCCAKLAGAPKLSERLDDADGDQVFRQACKLGLGGIFASGATAATAPGAAGMVACRFFRTFDQATASVCMTCG